MFERMLSRALLFALLSSIGALAQTLALPQVASVGPDYVFATNDEVLVHSNVTEISERSYRVDAAGTIDFPLIGRMQSSGLTVAALETTLIGRLREFYTQPQVTITVTSSRNETVSFLGAFKTPGVYRLSGRHTLIDMLAVAGGFQPNTSHRLRVTRLAEFGPIPLASAVSDPANKVSSVEIDIDALLQEIDPVEDIVLRASDRVIAYTSAPVYVGGEVGRPAGIDLNGQSSIPLLQALALAGGFTGTAKRHKVLVLRPVAGTSRVARIDVDIDRILQGKDNNLPLMANDVLYIERVSAFVAILPQATSSMLTSLPFAILTALINH